MAPERLETEIAVVGGGAAGAAAAAMLAEAGRAVVLLEARPLARAGARWTNGVPPWMFDRSGVARPREPEGGPPAGAWIMAGPLGAARLRVPEPGVWQVDAGRLGDRLLARARAAGARLLGSTRAVELVPDRQDRPACLRAERRGAVLEIRARLFVDGSGRAGALRSLVPALARLSPHPAPQELCLAAQEIRAVRDPAGARACLARLGLVPGETLSTVGIQGGFSVVSLGVTPGLARVELLSGTDGCAQGGARLLAELVSREAWIGPRLSGGRGVIDLRVPLARLAVPGVCLLGEAGRLVFPLHASGTGAALLSARLLAESVHGCADPGGREALSRFGRAVRAALAGPHAVYAELRRLLAVLAPADVERLVGRGLLSAGLVRAGLDQRLPGPSALAPASQARGLVDLLRAPGLAWRLTEMALRMGIALAISRAPAWSGVVSWPAAP